MKKEDRELLVRDLCARLPYNTVISVTNDDRNTIQYLVEEDIKDLRSTISYSGNIYKPYLFPLSSMTEEQLQEYTFIVNYMTGDSDDWAEGEFIYVDDVPSLTHFYNREHLDYRGLIPKGLAIDATRLNIY